MNDPLTKAREVKRQNEDRWLAMEGVVAVGIGQGEDERPKVVVSVEADSARLRRDIPEDVEGVEVEIQITGPMRPM